MRFSVQVLLSFLVGLGDGLFAAECVGCHGCFRFVQCALPAMVMQRYTLATRWCRTCDEIRTHRGACRGSAACVASAAVLKLDGRSRWRTRACVWPRMLG